MRRLIAFRAHKSMGQQEEEEEGMGGEASGHCQQALTDRTAACDSAVARKKRKSLSAMEEEEARGSAYARATGGTM